MDRIVELLFKYRPSLFRQGDFAFTAPPTLLIVAALSALLLIPILLRYRAASVPARQRWTLFGLRSAVIAVLVFCLLQPALVLSSVVPQQSFVGILADDSLSMRIADEGGAARSDVVTAALAPESDWRQRLEDRFRLRLFGFANDSRRLSGPEELRFDGRHTRIDRALAGALEELQAVPLSGLLLFTDGAQSDQEGLADVLLELRSREVPVYPVALGSPRITPDIEIAKVDAPERVLLGSELQVDVTISQSGFSGETVSLEVEDEGRIVAVEEVVFPTGGAAVVKTVTFAADEKGPRRFRFSVAPRSRETITENNQRTHVISVEDRTEKVLYFEGEPRYEVKFIKRAVEPDENLQLVGMVRLADNHFFRFGLDNAAELADGFPLTREELYQYRALVLGSLEASFFTYEQLRMIADFVSERGGGLLLLGGRHSFSEGNYAGTPIEDLVPVELGPSTEESGAGFFAELRVRPTPSGRNSPVVQLVPDDADFGEFWDGLPTLSVHNPLFRLKPGATALLLGESDALESDEIVLAHQRYGRGRVIALAAQDTWRWQMMPPLEDQTHEIFWRQLMRWLVSYVPDSVELTAEAHRAQPNEPLRLRTRVRDDTFLDVNNALVAVTATAPSGAETVVPMQWTVNEDGLFEGEITPTEVGLYEIEAVAESGGATLGESTIFVEAAPIDDELFDARQRTDLLARLANETGGRAVAPGDLDQLLDELAYSRSGATVREFRDLWDMPALFLLLVGLLGGEWLVRRVRGLS